MNRQGLKYVDTVYHCGILDVKGRKQAMKKTIYVSKITVWQYNQLTQAGYRVIVRKHEGISPDAKGAQVRMRWSQAVGSVTVLARS